MNSYLRVNPSQVRHPRGFFQLVRWTIHRKIIPPLCHCFLGCLDFVPVNGLKTSIFSFRPEIKLQCDHEVAVPCGSHQNNYSIPRRQEGTTWVACWGNPDEVEKRLGEPMAPLRQPMMQWGNMNGNMNFMQVGHVDMLTWGRFVKKSTLGLAILNHFGILRAPYCIFV